VSRASFRASAALLGVALVAISPGRAPGQPASVRPTGPPSATPESAPAQPVGVDEFVGLAVARNPRLGRLTFNAEAARGRFVQAGLYPNPVFAFTADELGDRTGPPGILTPQMSQEIVRGNKLQLSQAVAAREVDQAVLAVFAERYALVGAVRAAFYEAYALQQRAVVLRELVRLSGEAVSTGEKLFAAKEIPRLDIIQLEVEQERFRADLEAVERELPAAYRRLAAVTGDPRLPVAELVARFDDPPPYDLDRTREVVLSVHPEVRSAQVGVERARAALRRAQVEPVPNVTVNSGYTRQNQNVSNDWQLGLSLPVPIWNRNQGNVRAAQAEIGAAVQDVGRVQNDLADRVATAFRTYASARRRAERYRTAIIPKATETYELSLVAFKGGQFEYLRVLQAQRTIGESKLEYNRSLGEAWRAAADMSGLLLEEAWPPAAEPPASAGPGPALLPNPKPDSGDGKEPAGEKNGGEIQKDKPDNEQDVGAAGTRSRAGPRVRSFNFVRLDSGGTLAIISAD
jgi:cobalt-zinc-cadmium efflux system outer membrane protein